MTTDRDPVVTTDREPTYEWRVMIDGVPLSAPAGERGVREQAALYAKYKPTIQRREVGDWEDVPS